MRSTTDKKIANHFELRKEKRACPWSMALHERLKFVCWGRYRVVFEYKVSGRILQYNAMLAKLPKIIELSKHSPVFFGVLAGIYESRQRISVGREF